MCGPPVEGFCWYRGADKSLARPGRKQATATKLSRLQATQKECRRLSVQPGFRGSSYFRVGQKMATFQMFFQSGRAKGLISTPVVCVTLGHLAAGSLARIPRMAEGMISLVRGIHCCPSIFHSFARPTSPYCEHNVYIYTYLTAYRLCMNYRCYRITLQ